MNELIVIAGISWITALGFTIIKLFRLRKDFSEMEKFSYSFGLGGGLIAMQLYAYSRIGLPWDIIFLLSPWILFILLTYKKEKIKIKTKIFKDTYSIIDKVLFFSILGLVLFVFIESVIHPLTAWDGWSSWLLRAKMFFVDGSISQNIFTYVPSEYPLIVSLLSTFFYLLIGNVDDRSVLLIYATYYLFLSLLFFFSTKPIIGRTKALLFTFLLLSTQNIVRHSGRYEAGQADIILGFYLFASSMLLIKYLQLKDMKSMVLLQIFLAITSLIKDDGISYVVFVELFLIIFLLKQKLYEHFYMFLFWMIPFIDWQIYKSILHLPKLPSYLLTTFHPGRLSIIFQEFTKQLMNIQDWNFLWPCFFISFFIYLYHYKKNMHLFVLYLLIFLQLGVYMGVFFFTVPNPIIHIPNVLNRALLHLAPTALYSIALVVSLINIQRKT